MRATKCEVFLTARGRRRRTRVDAYSEALVGVAAPLAGWEEKTWLTARTSREALARA
jgi:hypothetical protein